MSYRQLEEMMEERGVDGGGFFGRKNRRGDIVARLETAAVGQFGA